MTENVLLKNAEKANDNYSLTWTLIKKRQATSYFEA